LPLALTGGTLSAMLQEFGVSLKTIGLFAAIGTPYAIKFLWAPIIDNVRIPFLGKRLGHRKSWLLLVQILLCEQIMFMAFQDPSTDIWWVAAAAVVVATLSATQDIIIDAYRIELLKAEDQGHGSSAMVFGYRVGMLVSGAGALILADIEGWRITYLIMAFLVLSGIIAAVVIDSGKEDNIAMKQSVGAKAWIKTSVIDPFHDFSKNNGWFIILSFIVFFKLGDAFLGQMANSFYLKTGFTKTEIGSIAKVYGLCATLIGAFAGGWAIKRAGLTKTLYIAALVQMASNLIYIYQLHAGHDIKALMLTISTENLAGGFGTTAFVAYISLLCNKRFTATQFALLSSLSAFGRTWLSTPSGRMVEMLGWQNFFILSTIIAIPGIVLLILLHRRFPDSLQGKPQIILLD